MEKLFLEKRVVILNLMEELENEPNSPLDKNIAVKDLTSIRLTKDFMNSVQVKCLRVNKVNVEYCEDLRHKQVKWPFILVFFSRNLLMVAIDFSLCETAQCYATAIVCVLCITFVFTLFKE
jgi:hypothetical protein